MTYNVREHVPKHMRCFNGQIIGHTALTCKGKRRCDRCGEHHENEERDAAKMLELWGESQCGLWSGCKVQECRLTPQFLYFQSCFMSSIVTLTGIPLNQCVSLLHMASTCHFMFYYFFHPTSPFFLFLIIINDK